MTTAIQLRYRKLSSPELQSSYPSTSKIISLHWNKYGTASTRYLSFESFFIKKTASIIAEKKIAEG